jgi:hypothetical protein
MEYFWNCILNFIRDTITTIPTGTDMHIHNFTCLQKSCKAVSAFLGNNKLILWNSLFSYNRINTLLLYLLVTRRIRQMNWCVCQNMAICTVFPYHMDDIDVFGRKSAGNFWKSSKLWFILAWNIYSRAVKEL